MKLDLLDRTLHLPSRVANALQAEIENGRLTPGDRLPGEQALAETFGVSRNVVREAIARLRSDGVVQSRQGIGAFVVRDAASPILRIEPDVLSDRASFANVFEVRSMLEVRAAGLATRRGTPAQKQAITAALDRMRRADGWADAGVDADLDFHRTVALATGNDYIAKVVTFLSEHMRDSIMATRRGPRARLDAIMEITVAEHVAIHDAILGSELASARAAMQRHIINAAARVGIEIAPDD